MIDKIVDLVIHNAVTKGAIKILILLIILSFSISILLVIYDSTDPISTTTNDLKEASNAFDGLNQMNASIKNIESTKVRFTIKITEKLKIPLWYVGYNVSGDAFNAGSNGLLTVSCTAFNKKDGMLAAYKELSFHAGRNLLTPFTCEFKKDTLPKGDYDFNASIGKEEIYS